MARQLGENFACFPAAPYYRSTFLPTPACLPTLPTCGWMEVLAYVCIYAHGFFDHVHSRRVLLRSIGCVQKQTRLSV